MRTLSERIWDAHVVGRPGSDGDLPDALYVDLHLVHEVTSPQAFATLAERGLAVRRPERTLATMDHSVPTTPAPAGEPPAVSDPAAAAQLARLEASCTEHGIPLLALGDPGRGIVHVVAPELGLVQPGMTVVCGDSHTSTHGAFGALAFGIGTAQVAGVLATQCLLARRPRPFEVRLDGALRPAVTAKDVALAFIATVGADGGAGHVLEYRGTAVTAMDMEARMTLCNMSIEAGARAGMVAPDEVTFAHLAEGEHAPAGPAWDEAVARWRTLASDADAVYDRSASLDVSRLEPMVTFGTSPAMAIPVTGAVPDPGGVADGEERAALRRALEVMRVEPGRPLLGTPVDVVFLGSCTNGRLSDLRQAASVLRGRRLADGVRMLVVPGSGRVKREAEAEGLDEAFRGAGAEWREPGCSLCLAMNDDRVAPGSLVVSTSNRNFEGRQGPGVRTVLASPPTAAACAIAGRVTDPREMLP